MKSSESWRFSLLHSYLLFAIQCGPIHSTSILNLLQLLRFANDSFFNQSLVHSSNAVRIKIRPTEYRSRMQTNVQETNSCTLRIRSNLRRKRRVKRNHSTQAGRPNPYHISIFDSFTPTTQSTLNIKCFACTLHAHSIERRKKTPTRFT